MLAMLFGPDGMLMGGNEETADALEVEVEVEEDEE